MFVNASKDWETAAKIVKSIRSFCSELRELEDYAANVERKGKAFAQLKLLQETNIQPEIVKAGISIFAIPALSAGDLDRPTVIKLAESIRTWPYVDVMKAWRFAQQRFPDLCGLVEKSLVPLLETSNRSLPAQFYPGFNPPPMRQSGGQMQVKSSSSDTAWIGWVILGVIGIAIVLAMNGGCG
jgi:hypothetical protein